MPLHTHTARLLLLEGVWVKKRKSACVCEWNERQTRTLKLPLSALSLELPSSHASGLLLLKDPPSQSKPLFTPKPDCHSSSSFAALYVFVPHCLLPSFSPVHLSRSVSVCLVGDEGLHTVARGKTETDWGEGKKRRTKLRGEQKKGGMRKWRWRKRRWRAGWEGWRWSKEMDRDEESNRWKEIKESRTDLSPFVIQWADWLWRAYVQLYLYMHGSDRWSVHVITLPEDRAPATSLWCWHAAAHMQASASTLCVRHASTIKSKHLSLLLFPFSITQNRFVMTPSENVWEVRGVKAAGLMFKIKNHSHHQTNISDDDD